jgi:cyclophilin family peptidyl-prolyl cis-trans isomerase
MAQTGDVQYGQLDAGWSLAGRGGSAQPNLPAEFSPTPFDRGIVGMARSQNLPDSANSQFFIMFEEAYHLNGNYTAVGIVTSGMEVVDAIKKGDGPNGAILGQPDVMKSVNSIDELLHINSETGEVTLKAPADFDKNPKYTFTVEVSDGTLTAYQTVTLSVSDEDSFVAGSVITRSEMAQTEIDVSIYTSPENLDIVSRQVVSTNETGSFSIELDNGLLVSTAIELAYSSSTKAVSSQDALDALKLSVGMTTAAGTKTAFDYISADFNQDGKVSSQDALSILKYSVGLTTPEQAKWVFVDTNGDYSGVSKSNTSYTEGVSIADLSADTTIGLTGILIGDVNDSYSGLIA